MDQRFLMEVLGSLACNNFKSRNWYIVTQSKGKKQDLRHYCFLKSSWQVRISIFFVVENKNSIYLADVVKFTSRNREASKPVRHP